MPHGDGYADVRAWKLPSGYMRGGCTVPGSWGNSRGGYGVCFWKRVPRAALLELRLLFHK